LRGVLSKRGKLVAWQNRKHAQYKPMHRGEVAGSKVRDREREKEGIGKERRPVERERHTIEGSPI
jgi:hypothetical protein